MQGDSWLSAFLVYCRLAPAVKTGEKSEFFNNLGYLVLVKSGLLVRGMGNMTQIRIRPPGTGLILFAVPTSFRLMS